MSLIMGGLASGIVAVLAPHVLPFLVSIGIPNEIGLQILKAGVWLGLNRRHVGTLKERLGKPLTEKEKEAVELHRAKQQIFGGGRSGFW